MLYVGRHRVVFLCVLSLCLLVLAGIAVLFGSAESAAQSLSTKLKIEVDETGLYGVSYDDIIAAGITDALDIDQMALSTSGQAVAFDVRGDGDNVLESGEQIVFYGEGVPRPHYGVHFYDTTFYWLAFDGAGVQITAQPNDIDASAAVIDSIPTTLIVEEDLRFTQTNRGQETWSQFDNPDSQTTWFWSIWSSGSPATQTFNVTIPYPVSTADHATITAELFLWGSVEENGNHDDVFYEIDFSVNDTLPAIHTLSGQNSLDIDVSVPTDALNAGDNTITIESVITDSVFLLNHFEIAYERALIADDNHLQWHYESVGNHTFHVSGFDTQAAAELLVWDVSNPAVPISIELMDSDLTEANGTTTAAIGLEHADAVQLVATTIDRLLAPIALTSYTPADIAPAAGGAEWVMITSDALLDEANRLADYRATSSDLTTLVVDVDEIIAQYGYGYSTPDAISAYLTDAMATWNPAPRYLVLGSGATYNPLLRTCETCYQWEIEDEMSVPMGAGFTDRWGGFSVSDYQYALIEGDDLLPDLAVGRLPALDATELSNMIDKIIAYETAIANEEAMAKNVVLIGEGDEIKGDNFCANNAVLSSTVFPDSMSVEQYCFADYRDGDEYDKALMTTEIFTNNLNSQGAHILQYTGHGATQNWGNNFLGSWDTDVWQNEHPTVIINGSCHDANIATPNTESIAHAFLALDGMRGSAAHWSATGGGYAIEHDLMHTGFYEALFEQGITTIGDAISYAKIEYIDAGYHPSELYNLNLMGDPAMQMVKAEEEATETPTPSPTIEATTPPTAVPPTAIPSTCTVYLDKAAAWTGHVQGNITIENNDTAPIAGWTLSWEMASYEGYQSGWNASMSQSGNTFTASNNASHWNGTIPGNGGTKTFGFTFTSSESDFAQPAYFDLNGMMCVNGNGTTEPPAIPTAVPTNTPAPTNTPVPTNTPMPTATTPPSTGGGGLCDVDYNLTHSWPGNFELNVQITNNDTTPIQNWELAWALGAGEAYSHGWDATFTPSGTNMTAAAPSWNSTIAAGGSASFGLQLTSNDDTLHIPADFFLNGASCNGTQPPVTPTPIPTLGTGDCSIAYDPVTAWSGHVELDVTITNHSTSMIDGWELLWSLGESENYYHGWNASITQNGTAMLALSPNDWNNQIQPNGGTVSFGLQLTTPDDVVQLPSEFVLNGAVCSSYVSDADVVTLQSSSYTEIAPVAPMPPPSGVGNVPDGVDTTDLPGFDDEPARPAILSAIFTPTSDTILPGEMVDVIVTIQNQGELASTQQRLKLTLSSSLELVMTEQEVTELALGLYHYIPAIDAGGTYSWLMRVKLDENAQADDVYITLAQAHGLNNDLRLDVPLPETRSATVKVAEQGETFADPESWKPQIIEPVVSQFSGAATYSYPFDIPGGRGGLTPSLGLSYNSRGIDGAGFRDSGDIAEGWSLGGIPFIYRSNIGLCKETIEGSPFYGAFLHGSEEAFQLNMNGSFKLFDRTAVAGLEATTALGQYDAEKAPGLFVQRQNFETTNGQIAHADYWLVKTPDGTTYRFGYTEDAKQVTTYVRSGSNKYDCDGSVNDQNEGSIVNRYWLDRVIDSDGNVMVIEYDTSVAYDVASTPEFGTRREVAVYPDKIYYNNTQDIDFTDELSETDLEDHFASTVDLVWYASDGRNTHTIAHSWKRSTNIMNMVGIKRLVDVNVTHMGETAWVYSLEREFIEGNDDGGLAAQLELSAIRKCYPDELSVVDENAVVAEFYCQDSEIPAVEFEYEAKESSKKQVVADNGYDTLIVPHMSSYLKRVKNEYGGVHEFVYSPMIDIDSEQGSTTDDYRAYFVEAINIWDGFEHIYYEDAGAETATSTINYHYRLEDACFDYSSTYAVTGPGQDRPINVHFKIDDQDGEEFYPPYCGSLDRLPENTKVNNLTTRYHDIPRSLGGFSQVVVTTNNADGLVESIVHKKYDTQPGGFFTGDKKSEATYYNQRAATSLYRTPDQILEGVGLPIAPLEATYAYTSSTHAPVWWCSNTDLAASAKCQIETRTRRYDETTGGKNEVIVRNYYNTTNLANTDGTSTGRRQLGMMTGQTNHVFQNTFWDGTTSLNLFAENGQLTQYLKQDMPDGSWLAKPWRQISHEGVDAEKVLAESLFLYDGQRDADSQTFTLGKLSASLIRDGGDGISDPRMLETAYVYDANNFGLLVDSIQYETALPVDEEAHLYARTNVAGRVSHIAYQANGLQLDAVTNVAGHVVSATYKTDRPWMIETIIGANGTTTEYQYDDVDRLIGVFAPDPVTGAPTYQTMAYDYTIGGITTTNGITLATVRIDETIAPGDAVNEMTSTTFLDGLGRARQTWTGAVEVADDNLTVSATTIGAVVSYDTLGRPNCQAGAIVITSTTLDHTMRCEDYDHPTTEYDALGRVIHTTGVDGSVMTQTYAIDAVTGYNIQTVIDPEGNKKQYETNILGQLRFVHEFNEGTATTPYGTTEYLYDTLSRLTNVIDTAGNETIIQYDALGRKTQMDDPDMGRWTYKYDLFGNLTAQTDNKAQTLCFGYDQLNRMTEKRLLDAGATDCDPAYSELLAAYSYDRDGAVGMMSQEYVPGVATRDWFYDLRGRVTDEVAQITNPLNPTITETFTATYTYDNLNRPETLTYPDGEVVTTTYNRQGAAVGLSGADAYVTNALYSIRGQMLKLNLGNGVETGYQYGGADDAYRLLTSNMFKGTQALQQFDYTYDSVGNILDITEHYLPEAGAAIVGPEVETFTYDGLYRLQTAQGTGAFAYDHASTPDLQYAYDEIGNITQYKGRSYDYETTHNKCDADPDAVTDQPLPHAVRTIGEDYFCYDANGNMTVRSETAENGTTKTYQQTFDAENRLVAVKVGSTNFTFAYNAMGGRVASVKDGADGKTVTLNPFPFFEIALETKTSPTAVVQNNGTSESGYPILLLLVTGSLLVITVYGQKRYGVVGRIALFFVIASIGATSLTPTPITQAVSNDFTRIERKTYLMGGVIAQRVNGSDDDGLFFLHGNHLGSITAMTNAAGELVENSVVRFLPFGEYRPNSNQTASPTQLGYTGHKQNDDIGLIYMNARYYVPGIARFASADVIIPEPTVAQAFNRYSYVHNNPLNYIDPTGHCRYNDDGEYEFATDCTQEEFESLSWDDRIKWVEDFMEYTGVEWFYNIIGILAYFRDDVVWSNSVWASVSDAAVLRVIQDGWRVANGASSIGVENDATNAWKKFFVGEANGEDDHILLRLWGEAEQAGVDYGIDLAEPYISSIMEEAYIDSFVAFGNVYRWMIVGDVGYVNWDDYTNPIIAPMQFALDKALSGLTSWALDPRNPSSAVFVYGFGRSVISPLGANWALFKGAIRIWN